MSKTDVPPAEWKPGAGAACGRRKTLAKRYRKKGLPGQGEKGSWFQECPRGPDGRCKPRGTGSEGAAGGGGAPQPKIKPHKPAGTGGGGGGHQYHPTGRKKPLKTKKTVFRTEKQGRVFARKLQQAGGEVVRTEPQEGGGFAVFWLRYDRHLKERQQQGKKSLDVLRKKYQTAKGKAMPAVETPPAATPTPPAADPAEGTGGDATQAREKYSAQLLRRIHEDLVIMLEDYDQLHPPLENEKVRRYVLKRLEKIVGEIDEVEKLFQNEHPDADPLENAVGTEDLEESDAKEMDTDEGEGEGESPEGESDDKDMVDANEADSGGGQPEVPPEDAAAGMKKEPKTKSLSQKYKKKSACAECGKENCSCGSKKDPPDVPGGEENQKKPGGTRSDLPGEEGHQPGTEERQEKPGEEGSPERLAEHHKGFVREAHSFLGDVSSTQDWGEDHRKKAYHHAEQLKSIAAGREVGEEKEREFAEGGDGSRPATDGKGMDASEKMTHCHKAVGAAGDFLGKLSGEMQFGEAHRAEAAEHQKALAPFAAMDEADSEAGVSEGGEAAGTTGEKALGVLRGAEALDKNLDRLLAML